VRGTGRTVEVNPYPLDLLERRKVHHYRSWLLACFLAEGSHSSSQPVKGPLRVCVCERERERKRREELRAGELTQHCLTLETVSSTNHPTASYTHKHTERERERERERDSLLPSS